MYQVSTPLTDQHYLLGQSIIVKCTFAKWTAFKLEGIVDVDIDNAIKNLRHSQDIYNLEVPVALGRVEVPANLAIGVVHFPKVLPMARVDTFTIRQALFVYSVFKVNTSKCQYTFEMYCNGHIYSHYQMKRAAEHVSY